MRYPALASMLSLLCACAPPPAQETAAPAPTPPESEAEDNGSTPDSRPDSGLDSGRHTGTELPGDTGRDSEPPLPDRGHWVLTELEVAHRSEGIDLDGDGSPDNALWSLAALIDPLLEAGLQGSEQVALIQLDEVDDYEHDASIRVGLIPAEDADGDPSDNDSGSEEFDPGAAVDPQGLALLGVPSALDGGRYTVALLTDSLKLGELEIALATGLWIEGEPTPDWHGGRIGAGISIDALVAALEVLGLDPETAELLTSLADLDTDGDGTEDALSVILAIGAPTCVLQD